MAFEVTRQRRFFNNIQDDERYYVVDDLLFDCIGLGCGNWERPNRVQGFNSGKAFGYALLTYFASIALNVRRIPFCEDRIYTQYYAHHDSHYEILSQLTSERIETIVREIRDLYTHTQSLLKKAGLEYVNVRREIKKIYSEYHTFSQLEMRHGYAETLVMLRKACDCLGISEIEFEMDTLNSYGDEGAYHSEVFIEVRVPASEVFYFSSMIGNRPGEPDTMESGEWVLINNSPTGIVKLPTASINYRKDLWKSDQPMSIDTAKKYMEKYEPIVFRSLYKHERNYGTYGIKPSLKQIFIRHLLKHI